MSSNTVVLAFSGGLDTSFCVPYLKEKGLDVVTLFVDTGGVDDEERAYIEARAIELGAVAHHTVDGGDDIWEEVVVPLVQGGEIYQQQYPLLCSDRYIIVRKSLQLCRELGTKKFAHGCTGMGNDQVRFDLTVKTLGDFEILAPIRDIQQEHGNVREYEKAFLEERGFSTRAKASRYTINENLLGVTTSGSEVDEWEAPGDETYQLTAHPSQWPREALRASITFEEGVAVALDGEPIAGPELISVLNKRFGAYGVGRGYYTGDTTVGLKGRIVFEAPGLTCLLAAHRALEEAVSTGYQNQFKPVVAQKWVELVYKGFFYEPLKFDLEAYIESSQIFVNGTVTLETWGGKVSAVKIDSPHILRRAGAVYAQSADWNVTEAEGFIKLLGQSSTLHALVNSDED
ncbi:argininosuccinate synthase [Lujinxingia vulgaris]|uniref:argininosuccinate synthase n=1 Tax=Lujinxingia vulgaris TaxID=2600176 RepID=A0A5C6X2Y6_9DELT|nr:argininosuccinate synthase [Lujinxingia vulgaris]TXD34619.1 argininosuccinate synthase [Lujinxingia vulgaris]